MQLETFLEKDGMDICGHWVSSNEIFISYNVGAQGASDLEPACEGPVLVILNTKADQDMQAWKTHFIGLLYTKALWIQLVHMA